MKFRSLVEPHFVSRLALRSDGDDGKSARDERPNDAPISDDTYNRIPDKFKKPEGGKTDDSKRHEDKTDDSKRREDGSGGNGSGGGKGSGSEPQRRPTASVVIFIFALAATFMLGYRSFFSPKSSEITWTAFNKLLDEGEIESAKLDGSSLSGKLRKVPTLIEWSEIMPDGKILFESAIVQYDRAHPKQAKELDDELAKECDALEFHIARPARPNATTPIVIRIVQEGSDNALTSVELPGSSTEEEVEEAKGELAKEYRFHRQIEQRWQLIEATKSFFSPGKNAWMMVDIKTNKPFGKVFFQKYTCEAPVFAYADGTLDARLRESLDSYTSVPQRDHSWTLTAISILVTLVFLIFIFKMMRNTRDQLMGGNGFGSMHSLAKKYDPDSAKRQTFEDVAGMDQVKAELVEVVDYLKNPAKYERMGARVPRGTLLFGPPGTGKTLLARAVAGEAGVPFYSINGSEFIQMFVGVGASRVRDIFSTARENAPSILFIDEIDAVGRQRGAGVGGGQDEREQTLNQILSEMDGFTQTDSVMVMASTNRPDVLDPALMRPGRFDRHITVGRPSMKGRVDIFKVYLKKIPYAADVDVDKLAAQTAGFTGADIRNYVNEATLWATRNDKNVVEASDFDFAFEKIALGLKREEIITPENKRKTAVHEAGHTVVGWFLPNGTKVHKVTIIPRGRALGVTWSLPEEDKLSYDASEARASLAHLLAGRVAEKLVYDETTSGVENDLQRATELARDMVARWGMSEKLGPVSFPNSETHPFLGREMTSEIRQYSEATAELIDEEIKEIVRQANKIAEDLLVSKRELFDELVEALVAEEELDRARLEEILGPGPGDKRSATAESDVVAEADDNSSEDADSEVSTNVHVSLEEHDASSLWSLPDPFAKDGNPSNDDDSQRKDPE